MIRRIAMVVGDTAGHVLPALALAEAYRADAPPAEVSFIAASGSSAATLIPAFGHALDVVPALPLMRVGIAGKAAGGLQVGATIAAARRVLRRLGARLVIGTGGYATGGVLLAARSLGLRTAILEANAVPGLANRWLSRCVHRCYVALDDAAPHFPPRRTISTGLPVRAPVARLAGRNVPNAPRRPPRLLVTSGSRGDTFFAAAVPPALAALRDMSVQTEVRHQSGAADPAPIRSAYAALGVQATVMPFADDMADAYAWADLVISRAGAGTLAELALAGLPALLVPLADAAADHQACNAEAWQRRGAALMLRESEWSTPRVAETLSTLLTREQRWKAMSDAMRSLARPGAAQAIVRDCEAMMDGRW